MDKSTIGIFDSGVGGLTVLSEMKKQLPNEKFVYIGDTKNFPYGNKTKEQIIEYSIQNTQKLIELGAKIIIIACGTATSQAIETLKEKFTVPVIGIIEPTVKYIKEQQINKVGVMATEGTIKSGAWEKNIKAEIKNIQVINKACPKLAPIAQNGNEAKEEGKKAIREYIEPFKKNNINKIILGCTHYSIYENVIKEEFGETVELINTGVTVSKEVIKYLQENNLLRKEKSNEDLILITKPEEKFKEIAKKILGFDAKISENT